MSDTAVTTEQPSRSPLSDEVALKRRAAALGLLVMGPDCGTAILSGVGLGFANRVARGPVGIVGASGTGIQELSCLLDRMNVGVSHAIGTGSRDLSEAVDGAMTEAGLPSAALGATTDAGQALIFNLAPGPASVSAVLGATPLSPSLRAGSQQPTDVQASAGTSLAQAASNAERGNITAAKGTLDVDTGPTTMVTETGATPRFWTPMLVLKLVFFLSWGMTPTCPDVNPSAMARAGFAP